MSDEEIGAKLDSLIDETRETQQWIKLLALEETGDRLASAIGEDDENKRLYEALDGETSLDEIIEGLEMSRRTAYRRLDEWQKIGIVSKRERGRYDKIAALTTLGIDPP